MVLSDTVVALLFRFRFFILSTTLVLVGLSAWQAPFAISRATTQFNPPSSSLAVFADNLLSVSFPSRGVGSTQFAIFVETSDSEDVVHEFSRSLNATVSPMLVAGCGVVGILAFNR
jgi:hypothetical protein